MRDGRGSRVLASAAVLCASVCSSPAAAERTPPEVALFETRSATRALVLLDWDREVADAAHARGLPFRVPGVRLDTDTVVDLELEPFSVISPRTRFVLGRRSGPDRELPVDPSRFSLFHGSVSGIAESRVYLALSDDLTTGHVDLGNARFRFSGAGADGESLAPGTAAVFATRRSAVPPPDVPLCGLESGDSFDPGDLGLTPDGPEATTGDPLKGLLHLELAVETDNEFFVLFDDVTAATDYLTAMYGEVSAIYIRDVETRIELTFARIWDQPDDLFNDVDPSPLEEFRDYWNANMGGVHRDVAQLLSGRRDYPFGGQAYLNALCNSSAYSVVGYALGFFPDPSTPSPYTYDISVSAHEIGHNAGTGHTHSSPNFIDTCDDPMSTPQRGTIMSYCGQTWSGGNANRDPYFHATIQSNMDSYIGSVSCVVDDCNRNGVDDATDVAGATSDDVNANGVPDECEDCDGNAVLDDADISGGAPDVDGNGVPDACQPDCNANGIPDAKDIADGTSLDAYGNDVPDECEADCDTDGTSDYTQIQLDMTLDVDRDRVLDACQDCDGDGTDDFAALQGAHHAWIASGEPLSDVREFHASTGVLTRVTSGGGGPQVNAGHDLVVGPGGRVFVTSHDDDRVVEFDAGGAYVGDFVPAGGGGLSSPNGLAVSPDDATLLVASGGTDEVLAYDLATGASNGAFVAAGAGGLSGPFGLTFGPGGDLYVTSATDEILRYDGTTGAFAGTFVSATANDTLDRPRGLTFKPDGNLLVASFGTDEVLEFDGTTGAPRGQWAQVGTATRLTQVSPWGVRVGPNGNVYVARTGEDFGSGGGGAHHHADLANVEALHLTNAQIYEFDATDGNFLRAYVGGNDHGLVFPTGFDFVTRWDLDCNLSGLPDACDISLGASEDLDMNGTPDECEIDCNGNGILDRLDVIPYGPLKDCNGNLVPDDCDLTSGSSQDCTANGIPDECEIDCNLNGVPDSCEIDSGAAVDCDGNGIPDDCDVSDDLETDTGWIVGALGDNATSGYWTRVDPIGTDAQPEDDRTPGAGRTCFVTGQGTPGGANDEADVDRGQTTLTTPTFDLSADPDVEISYWRWFSNDEGSAPNEDVLRIDISNDGGGNWTNVEIVGPVVDAGGDWKRHRFRVADFVTPSNQVVLRFVASDENDKSTVEAAIDDLAILDSCCIAPLEITGLRVDRPGPTRLSWTGQGGVVFDVVSGDVATMRSAGDVGDATCQGDDLIANSWDDPRADPAPDSGFYYLVRAEDCVKGGYGTSSGGAPRTPVADCP